MTALRLKLQKEVFDVTEEQLVCLAHVTRHEKKKREWILCLARTNDVPVYVKIYLLKKTEKETFKKKQEWQLRDLKVLDGVALESQEIRMDLDERYTWIVSSVDEKDSFLKIVQNLCDRYNIGRKTKYLNINTAGEASARGQGGMLVVEDHPSKEDESDSGYQAISDKETSDLRALMSGCDTAVTAADQFADRLTAELSILDGDNIHSMMASEEAVDNLMDLLTNAISEVELLESRLNQYDDLLEHIRDSMEKMEGKTESLETVNDNNSKLLLELDTLILKLQISYEHQMLLQEADFTNTDNLPRTIEAAQALSAAMLAPLPFSLTRMAAVQEQRKRMDRLKDRFSKPLCRYLNNVFIHLGNEGSDGLGAHHSGRELTLPSRTNIHKNLLGYAELMHWLKQMEPKSYQQLQKTYTSSLEKLYTRDLERFFEDAFIRVSGSGPPAGVSHQDVSQLKKGNKVSIAGSTLILGGEAYVTKGDETKQERERFDLVTSQLLACLEPIVMAEQEFCVQFFKMDSKLEGSKLSSSNRTKKQVTEEVRAMMNQLFLSMETHLVRFLAYYEGKDGFYSMLSYVRLSSAVLQAQDTGSFLAITLGSALIHTKRNFDKLMQTQLRSIEDCKPPKKNKCGIISFVSNFLEFANNTEIIFSSSDRRTDIEKWYLTLVSSMMDNIPRIAKEHQKSPQAVVKMENFHHLHASLSRLKIPVLDSLKRDAKQKYTDALHNYVTQYFGRPLEKVNTFFDGVSARINAGVKENEISYQLQFSKQELRKVLVLYPGKEVRGGLERLYKKVEKHLCEDENLLQVVWHAMQEEFIRQYKYIEDLLERCYPGAQISLDFTMSDILEYFSDIAMHH